VLNFGDNGRGMDEKCKEKKKGKSVDGGENGVCLLLRRSADPGYSL